MQDQPAPDELLGSVIDFLRETVVPEAGPRTAFQARVAEAMQNGTVSRWERTALLRQYWSDSSALAVEFEVGEIAAERQALAALVGGQEGHS